MDLNFSAESAGARLCFAPGFALGYAALLVDLWGREELGCSPRQQG